MGNDDVSEYELCALCCHVDSRVVDSGHYVTYAIHDDSVTWYKFDDVTVTKVDIGVELMTESLQQNVYLLFYRRLTSSWPTDLSQGHTEVSIKREQECSRRLCWNYMNNNVDLWVWYLM